MLPGIPGVSADTYALFVSKLTVYKNSGGTFKKISQKKLMTLNREDEKEDGNRYYDHIRFPNITTADVNCDGYEEIVVAGYYNEVKEEKTYGFLANSDTDASNMGYAVYYSENDAITNVQKIAMSSYTAGGTNNNGVKPKPAMTGVAINGRGTPEQVFIAGALYEVQENGGLNLLCDTTREKNSSARWWWYYQDAIAGNFDHNTEGREQVIALAAERQNGTKNARKFDLFTDVFYGEDFGSGTLSVAGKYTATAEKDEYSKLCHAVDLAWDNYEMLSAEAALRGEVIACRLRHLIYETTTIRKAEYLTSAGVMQGISVIEKDGILEITLPCLLPKKSKKHSCEYLTDPIYYTLSKYAQTHTLPKFRHCVVCFSHIYSRELSPNRVRDYDNLELKQLLDAIATFVMEDDTGLLCDAYNTTDIGDSDCTRVSVMDKERFQGWLSDRENRLRSISDL